MARNLTNSYCDRQNILNNSNLLQKIEQHFNFDELFQGRIVYQDNLVVTKWQLEHLFDVSANSINKYVRAYKEELKYSGYVILKGEKLESFYNFCDQRIIEKNIKYNLDVLRIRGLELFSFKVLLNIAMLLSESEQAKFIRSRILDIVIDTKIKRDNGYMRYIDRQTKYYFSLAHRTYYSCSSAFQDAVEQYVESSVSFVKGFSGEYFKISASPSYDKVYELIFDNKHEQYRQYLGRWTSSYECERDKYKSESRFCSNSSIKNRFRIFLCHEIDRAITDIENLLSQEIQFASEQNNRQIKFKELDEIVLSIENNHHFKPFIQEARTKMAIINLLNSSEKPLESILNEKMEAHYKIFATTDLNDFIAAKTQSSKEKLSNPEIIAVFQRLKDR